MLTGNMIAQLIPLLITPILSRLFSVEEFGVFALYSSIATFFMVIAAGRYETAILLPKEDKDAVNILALSFLILTGLTLLVTAVVLIFPVADLFDTPELSDILIFLPLTIFFWCGIPNPHLLEQPKKAIPSHLNFFCHPSHFPRWNKPFRRNVCWRVLGNRTFKGIFQGLIFRQRRNDSWCSCLGYEQFGCWFDFGLCLRHHSIC